MVEQNSSLNAIFHAMADPTRRQMLLELRGGRRSVSQLAKPLEMSLAGAAKHVQVLVDAGLITRRKVGRTRFCELDPLAFVEAKHWLDQYSAFWNERLDVLENLLNLEQREGKPDE